MPTLSPPPDHHTLAAPEEWARLVRLCASLSGSADAAEDLAQETLIEAWLHADDLRDPDARPAWLRGIARNVCLRWRRRLGRDIALRERQSLAVPTEPAPRDTPHESAERKELASLLEGAIGALPDATREPILLHLLHDRPQAEIAERLGITPGAVAVRVHRGKRALRQAMIHPALAEHAAGLGIALPAPGWTSSRLWCPFCGTHHLEHGTDAATGVRTWRCAGRCMFDGTLMSATPGAMPIRPSATPHRELAHLHGVYRAALAAGESRCERCGGQVRLRRWTDDSTLDPRHPHGLSLTCHPCDVDNTASLWHLLIDTPDAQAFWQRHPHMAALSVQVITFAGRTALLGGFADRASSARLEIVSDRATYELLHIERTP